MTDDEITLNDDNGKVVISGDMIEDDKIPVCYQYRIELLETCGFDTNSAKVIGIFMSAFPHYSKYFGGVWVAS